MLCVNGNDNEKEMLIQEEKNCWDYILEENIRDLVEQGND